METPTMIGSARSTAYYNPNNEVMLAGAALNNLANNPDIIRRLKLDHPILQMQAEVIPMAVAQRRVVQVFISDTNLNVPLDDCLIYEGKQKLTDATDQELFFEVNIKELLDAHNEKRVKLVDKTIKDRTEYLEPAKIREKSVI